MVKVQAWVDFQGGKGVYCRESPVIEGFVGYKRRFALGIQRMGI